MPERTRLERNPHELDDDGAHALPVDGLFRWGAFGCFSLLAGAGAIVVIAMVITIIVER